MKRLAISFLFLLLSCYSQESKAQSAYWNWVSPGVSNYPAYNPYMISYYNGASGLVTDASGNSYALGYYVNYLTLGSGNLKINLNGPSGQDMFLARYDKDGNLKWAKSTASKGLVTGTHVALDKIGHIYVSGYIWDLDTLDFGNGVKVVSNYSVNDVFLACYDLSGKALWATLSWCDDKDPENIGVSSTSMDVDSAGNTIVTGNFDGKFAFGNDTLTAHKTIYGGKSASFAAIFNSKGKLINLYKYYDNSYVINGLIPLWDGKGSFYLTGYFGTSVHVGKDSVTGNDSSGIFIAKIDTLNNLIWSRVIKGDAYSHDIKKDPSGNIIVSGSFDEPLDFGGVRMQASSNFTAGFVAKYSNSGALRWAKREDYSLNKNQSQFISKISTDQSGNIYLAGDFTDTLIWGIISDSSKGKNDLFVTKLDSNGVFNWTQSAGSTGDDLISGISVDQSGNVYVDGSIPNKSQTYFGDTSIISTSAWGSFFMSRISPCGNISLAINDSGMMKYCSYLDSTPHAIRANSITGNLQYQWYRNNRMIRNASDSFFYPHDSGNYTLIVTDARGCSAISQSQYIAKVAPETVGILNHGDTLMASGGEAYQWYKDSLPIKGATKNTYIADSSGNFTVEIIDSNGCSSVSQAFKFTGISSNEETNLQINIFPDPFKERLIITIQTETPVSPQIFLYNITGKLVFHNENKQVCSGKCDFTIESESFNNISGMYILKIVIGNSIITRQVVKY